MFKQLASIGATSDSCMHVVVGNVFKDEIVNCGTFIALVTFYCYSVKLDYEKNCNKEIILNIEYSVSLYLKLNMVKLIEKLRTMI